MRKKISKTCKSAVSAIIIAYALNIQVFAQVSSGLMKCNDVEKNIKFTVQFKNNQVWLVLKGSTYRVPYTRAFVQRSGLRMSVYQNNEIDISTTLPYDKYVAIYTMPRGDLIADAFCE